MCFGCKRARVSAIRGVRMAMDASRLNIRLPFCFHIAKKVSTIYNRCHGSLAVCANVHDAVWPEGKGIGERKLSICRI